MKRLNKGATASCGGEPTPTKYHGCDAVLRWSERIWGFRIMKLMGLFAVLVMGFSVLFSMSIVVRDPPSDAIWTVVNARNLDFNLQKAAIANEDDQPVQVPKDKLLGDLLPVGFDEKSCLSRYQSLLYRRGMPRKASPYLISKLRRYEALHRKCGPHTRSYNETVEHLKSNRHPDTLECKYVIWISFSGLGNRILTLASAFLYALLTDRVLLVDRGVDIPDLFCEPFPGTSWLLPLDFPLARELNTFNQTTRQSYGNLLKSNLTSSSLKSPPYVYLHLAHDYDDQDKLFFCQEDQMYLTGTPWLIMKTNTYFVPSLFLIPGFEHELRDLFPDKETVFHLLGRYLFHPTNAVWGLIIRYYEAYLSKSDVRVGIQIRVFDYHQGPFKYISDQILSCTTKEGILPKIYVQERVIDPTRKQKTVAVMITSLSGGYFEEIRDLYWEHATATGEVISVHQPSQEGHQKTSHDHSRKAWAEMYLLSLSDKLVTSAWSTFGYVAQGLGGMKSWILYEAVNETTPEPACGRAVSMEPCFHAPPFYDCKMRRGGDTGALVPHVKHCEDMSWGLKLFQHHSEL